MELLGNHRDFWVYRFDNCWQEKRQSLDGNVVEQENERCRQDNRIEDTTQRLLLVQSIQDFDLAYTFRL